MKNFKSLLIIYFAGGSDDVPKNNAEFLVAKAATLDKLKDTIVIPLVESDKSGTYNLSEYKSKLVGPVCVYVVGHGTATSDRVGGCTAKDLAQTLRSLVDKYQLARVSIVACHSGGDGKAAPHRFVEDLWGYVKGAIVEVTGYTGSVRLESEGYAVGPPDKLPSDATRFISWSGEEWWIKKGGIRKNIGHQHDEGDNSRKIYISESKGITARTWTNKL